MNVATDQSLLHTPLHALHEELGARFVPFAGFTMPLQYREGIIREHLHTRRAAGLFDVSHMGQVWVSGSEAAAALESVLPTDALGLAPGRQRYTFLTNDDGGIRDDLIIGNLGERYLLVVNAACRREDVAYLHQRIGTRCEVHSDAHRALLALQGPAAATVLARFAPDAAALKFMSVAPMRVAGFDCIVARSGYTGEDGFEIGVSADDAETLARTLLADDAVAPAGLGARDSLRLEAGLCLYGQDLDERTTPVEAALEWAIPAIRRPGGQRAGGYPGAATIARQLADGVARRRVGLAPASRVPIRAGTPLKDAGGREAGVVTSGGFGPSVNAPVAMGYVATPLATPGTTLTAVIRGQPIPVRVALRRTTGSDHGMRP